MNTKLLCTIVALMALATISNAQTLLAQARAAGSGEWGYIDGKGEFAIPARYKDCHPFGTNGLAGIYDKKRKSYYLIDTKGNEVTTELSTFHLKTAFGWGLVNFNEGMIPVEVKKKWGYMNSVGKLVVPANYDAASLFADGVGVVKVGKGFKLVKADGSEVLIELAGATDVKRFSEGLAPARDANDLFGYIDPNGKVVITPQFKTVGYFNEGLAWAKNDEGMVGYINKKGEWAIQPTFKAAKDFKGSGYARVKMDDGWKFVNTSGEVMTIAGATSIGDMQEGMAYAKKGDKVGFVNTKGEWVIPAKYEAAKDFKNGYARVKQGDSWGMIDKSGNMVIPATFDRLMDFSLIE